MIRMTAPVRPPRREHGGSAVLEPPRPTGLTEEELRELRHEVRNALAAASGYADYLLRRLGDQADDWERHALQTIRESVKRADSLLGPRGGPPTPKGCDLRELVHHAIDQIPPERAPDVQLELPADRRLAGSWQPERVAQILANLLSNASKYSQVGTPILIRLSRVGEFARLAVKDTGIGFDYDDAEAIFNGHRTDAAQSVATGSGLGLRVSRRLAEAERGRLWAASIPTRGSTFYLELPLTEDGL